MSINKTSQVSEQPVIKVSVVISSKMITVKQWTQKQWELECIIFDPDGPDKIEGPIKIRESDTMSQYLWKGLRIKLYVDGSEGYWYNLMSEKPYAFALCDHDPDDDEEVPMPYLVTVSQDEAGAHLETDGMVLSGPLPSNIVNEVEKFVVANYVPEVKKKRKRKNWVEDSIRNKPEIMNTGNMNDV